MQMPLSAANSYEQRCQTGPQEGAQATVYMIIKQLQLLMSPKLMEMS
jgi:hypothetical protein